MKTLKIFSFFLLLSLAWTSCQEKAKVDVTAENTQQKVDEAFTASKNQFEQNVQQFKDRLDARIQEVENELNAATDDAKVDINVRLDGLRKQRNDLEQLGQRISNATAEGWADLEREASQMFTDIKLALQ